MKTYFVIKVGNHICPASTDFYNREFGEAFGDEILGTISAPDSGTAWEIIRKNYYLEAK